MDLSGTTAAVTGAAGFIGSAVCARLSAEGATVAGLDLPGADAGRVAAAGAEFRPADVTDAAAVREAVAGADLVVHTAAIVTDWGPMAEFVRVNVGGTRNVLDAAEAAGARTVHVSSVAVWGYEFREDLPEDAEPRPCGNPYIDTKGTSDVLARARGAAVVRPGDVYGPGSVPWAVRPLEAMKARRFQLPSGRPGIMTPVYVDDLVDCIVRAGTAAGAEGVAFTAWDGQPVTTTEFFRHYARMLGRDRVPTLPRPVLVAALLAQEAVAHATGTPPAVSRSALTFVSRRAAYPTALARERLGWAPQVGLEEGMRRTEAWFRAEGLLP